MLAIGTQTPSKIYNSRASMSLVPAFVEYDIGFESNGAGNLRRRAGSSYLTALPVLFS